MPKKHSITLYEVENQGRYHEHWLAASALGAARRAVAHAQECGLELDRVDVSAMVQPEDASRGGLVYVANDTRTYAIERGRVRRVDRPGEPMPDSSTCIPEAATDHRSRQFPPIRRSSGM
jgi:hypothetical protein